MTLLAHQVCLALKRKPAARGTRAPPEPSIVGWFCRLPEPSSGVGSVAPGVCLLALVTARASLAARHGDVQSDSRRATTRERLTGVKTAAPSPRCGVRGLRRAFRTVRFTRSMKAVFNRP